MRGWRSRAGLTTVETLTALNKHSETLFSPQFALVLVITAINGLAFSTFFLLPKYLAVELGADASTIGGVSAITQLASVIGMPLAGALVDRYGRRRFAVIGALLFAVSSAGFVLLERTGALLWTLRLAQGLAYPFYYLALSTLATDISPRARMGEAIGLFGAVMISTNALGPAFAEWGAHVFGWHAVFGSTVLAALLAALLSRFLHEPSRPPIREAAAPLLRLVFRPGLRRILLVTVLVGWTFSSMFTFYQPWALANGYTEVSMFLVAFSMSAMVMRVGLGRLADSFGRLRVAKAILVLYTLAPLALIGLPTLGLVVTGGLMGIAHGIFFPTLNAVAVEFSKDSERGKAMGTYSAAFNVGFSSGAYILGNLALAHGFPVIFMVAAATCAVAFFVLLFTGDAASFRNE